MLGLLTSFLSGALFGWLGMRFSKKKNWPYWASLVLGVLGTLIGFVIGLNVYVAFFDICWPGC